MATRIVLVTSCLVAMATLVMPQPQCSKYPTPTKANTINITPSLELWDTIGVIIGLGAFALLVSILYLLVR